MAGRSLEVHLETRGPYLHARLEGTIDETLDLSGLIEAARGKRVVLFLSNVTRLSSFGVREWTYTMRQLCHKAEQVFFAECSPAIVAQLNVVANFGGDARILSVQAPYFCPHCDTDTQITLNLTGMQDVELSELPCPNCAEPMEFEDDPSSYLSYALEHQASERSNPGWDGLVLPVSTPPTPSGVPAMSQSSPKSLSTGDVSEPATRMDGSSPSHITPSFMRQGQLPIPEPAGGVRSTVTAIVVGFAVSSALMVALYFLLPS